MIGVAGDECSEAAGMSGGDVRRTQPAVRVSGRCGEPKAAARRHSAA